MPKQIEDAAREADELHRKMYPDQYPDEKTDDTSDKSDDDNTPTDDGKTDDGDSQKAPDEGTPPDAQQKSGADDGQKKPDEEDWKQKYHVLKGKYDAEVPRLHADVSALRQVVTDLQTQIKEVVEKKDDSQKKTDDTDDETLNFVSREYPEIYAAIEKLVEKKSGKGKQEDEAKLVKRIEAVERVAVDTAEDRFFRDLTEVSPEWRTHKDDPRFMEWLQSEDPLTGYSRFSLAQQAQNALDGKRVGKFYQAFVKEVVGTKPAENGNGEKKEDKKDMSKFVAPPSSGGKGQTGKAGSDDNTITTSDIKKFYDDAQKGRYRGRDEEYRKMEAKIDRAVSEGKVIKG
jgi:hypothetical protein